MSVLSEYMTALLEYFNHVLSDIGQANFNQNVNGFPETLETPSVRYTRAILDKICFILDNFITTQSIFTKLGDKYHMFISFLHATKL